MQRAWDTPKIAACPDSGCACCSLKSQYPQIVMPPLFRKRGHFSSPILKKRQKNVRCIVKGVFQYAGSHATHPQGNLPERAETESHSHNNRHMRVNKLLELDEDVPDSDRIEKQHYIEKMKPEYKNRK